MVVVVAVVIVVVLVIAYLSIYLSIYLPVCKLAKLRGSKAQQFCEISSKQSCETASIFEGDNIKNEAILRGFLQKWKAVSLMNMSLVLRLPRKMHVCRSSSNAPCLPMLFKLLQNPRVLLTFDKVHNPLRHNPLRLPLKTISERLKVLRPGQFLTPLTSKCASHHNGVHLFSI